MASIPVKVFALSYPDPFIIARIILLDSSRVNTTLFDVDQTWLAISIDSLG